MAKINTGLTYYRLRFHMIIDTCFLPMHNFVGSLLQLIEQLQQSHVHYSWYTLNKKYNEHTFEKIPLARCASAPLDYLVLQRVRQLMSQTYVVLSRTICVVEPYC